MSTSNTNSHQNAQKGTPRQKQAPNNHSLALINIFAPEQPFQNNRSGVEFLSHLVLEIASLQERLVRPEQQDFYFRKGIEGNEHKLSLLKQHFNTLRKEVNAANRCALADEIKCVKEFLVWYKKHSYAGFIQSVVINNKSSQIRHLELILGLKTDVGYIKPLCFYI